MDAEGPYRKGAEADIRLQAGIILKERVAKSYRIPQLDVRLRRQRTNREAKNLKRALDLGVLAPKVLRCDPKTFTLELEYVDGPLVKTSFDLGDRIAETSCEIGRQLRRLHDGGLVHNDLTTSNMILSARGVCIIDFGLGFHTDRLEDKAQDLVVFRKSVQAGHTRHAEDIWINLLNGYLPDKEMMARIQTIENRVRYK
jgi:Kae1-associated kinase Bud32